MNEVVFVKLDTMTEREREGGGAVAVASERKTGTVDGMYCSWIVVARVGFHERNHQGFCRKSTISTIDLCIDDVRINKPSEQALKADFDGKSLCDREGSYCAKERVAL